MSADKRSVSTDALETLGTIIGAGAGRDAIHIAVEPIVASQKLYPAQDIGLREDGQALALPEGHPKALGIVDPFLKAPVQAGERFWMLIYPRQITSLRHVWTHPNLPDAPEYHAKDEVDASESWLRNFCENADCPGYEMVMEVIAKGETGEGYHRSYLDGEYMHFGGWDAHGEIPPEFWHHVEVVTGRRIPTERRASYFSCSC